MKHTPHNIGKLKLMGEIFPKAEPGQSALDVGCATGEITKIIRDNGYATTAIDNSPGLQSLHIEGINFQHVDFFEFCKDTNASYDFIYCGGVIEHYTDTKGFLLKLKSLLKPGGKILLGIPNKFPFIAMLFKTEWNCWDKDHISMFSYEEAKALISSCCLDVIDQYGYHYFTPIQDTWLECDNPKEVNKTFEQLYTYYTNEEQWLPHAAVFYFILEHSKLKQCEVKNYG